MNQDETSEILLALKKFVLRVTDDTRIRTPEEISILPDIIRILLG